MKRVAFDLVGLVFARANDDPAAGRAHSTRARFPVVDARHELIVGYECRDELLFGMPASRQERCAGRSDAAQDYEFASLHFFSSGFRVQGSVFSVQPGTLNSEP